MAVQAIPAPFTPDDFLEFYSEQEVGLRRFELFGGEVVERPVANYVHDESKEHSLQDSAISILDHTGSTYICAPRLPGQKSCTMPTPGRMLSPLKGIRSPAARPKPWPHKHLWDFTTMVQNL
jgi:hypothetical protein